MKGRALVMRIPPARPWVAICLILTLVCIVGIPTAANAERMNVAVIEFDVKGDLDIKDAGAIIAESMVTALSKENQYDLKERVLLKKLLQEQSLEASGAIEQQTAVQIGKLYGVQAIVTGSVTKWAQTVTVNARLIDTTTGSVLKADSVESNDPNGIPKLIGILAKRLSGTSDTTPPTNQTTNTNNLSQAKVEFTSMQFFAAGPKVPPQDQRQFATRFDKDSARFIYTQIHYNNNGYNITDQEFQILYRYYKPDGSVLAEVRGAAHPKKDWEAGTYTDCYETPPASWDTGTYTVKVYFDGNYVGENKFEVYGSSIGDLATFQKLVVFEAGDTVPPRERRNFASRFSKYSTRYIYGQITYDNKMYNVRDQAVDVIFRYYKPDGSFMGEVTGTCNAKKDWEGATYYMGYGWVSSGNWPLGTYTLKAYLNNTYVGETQFTIF